MLKRLFILLCASLLGVVGAAGQNLPEPMSPPRLVNDFVGLLTSKQQNALEQKLEAFDRKTSTQIAVVAVDDLDGYAPGDYAQRLYDKWGIGRKGKDNGIFILVKPKTAASNGQVFISVGYGLEGVVPDITAGRIIDTEMLPEFRKGDYYAGIDRAATVLIKLTEGEFTADAYGKQGDPTGLTGGLILFIVFIVFALLSRGGRGKGGDGTGNSGGRRGMWIPPVIIGGRGGGGFSGGGGFGGFGGGMSGGGGGGRSW